MATIVYMIKPSNKYKEAIGPSIGLLAVDDAIKCHAWDVRNAYSLLVEHACACERHLSSKTVQLNFFFEVEDTVLILLIRGLICNNLVCLMFITI